MQEDGADWAHMEDIDAEKDILDFLGIEDVTDILDDIERGEITIADINEDLDIICRGVELLRTTIKQLWEKRCTTSQVKMDTSNLLQPASKIQKMEEQH